MEPNLLRLEDVNFFQNQLEKAKERLERKIMFSKHRNRLVGWFIINIQIFSKDAFVRQKPQILSCLRGQFPC